jgi:hypothetical protein
MRHLVYLLLIANLVYFGWNLYSNGAAGETSRELPPLPATAKPLVTLQELNQQSATAPGEGLPGIDALTLSQPPGVGMPAACQALGPFFVEDELHAVAGRLGELGQEPRQRIVEVSRENGYWVYLPAMKRAQALQIAQQLDEQNDHEYYIGRDNFMSLGTFKELSRAEIRLRQLHKMGLDAILEARHVTQDAYWLEIRDEAAAAPVLDEVMGENPDLRLRVLACL